MIHIKLAHIRILNMLLHMSFKLKLMSKRCVTYRTSKGFFPCMNKYVTVETLTASKTVAAKFTLKRTFTSVN